ncbi:FecR family protein [Niabella ginsenosidivorans]|uniref:FecR family protein n=1 Tax=Niabella ginsenosidivorans TaxID=1176587 RepID=UPI001472179C|nr:FecR family protein [Niabella ginsenosidivorans]
MSNRSGYAEAEEVYAWLTANPGELDKIILTEDLQAEELVYTPDKVKKAALDRALGRSIARSVPIRRWLAAASVIGLMLALVWLFRGGKKEQGTVMASAITVRNNTGAIMDYLLPDSSRLSLNPGATIVFENDFSINRLVMLTKGDVYFRVKKDAFHPFRVLANGISTTAVGTQFWVQQLTPYRVNVSLTEGRVMIRAADHYFKMDTVFLVPGQNCTIDKTTGLVSVWTSEAKSHPQDIKAPSGKQGIVQKRSAIVWTNLEIQLSDAELVNVFSKLENRYNVKIIVPDTSIYHATITGKIFYNDSLDVLIAAICELNQLSYEKSNDTIFLKRKP